MWRTRVRSGVAVVTRPTATAALSGTAPLAFAPAGASAPTGDDAFEALASFDTPSRRNLLCTILFMDLVGYTARSVDDQVAIKGRLNDLVTRTLRELEQGLDRVMLARTVAGDWLARADAIETAQQDTAAGVEQVRAQAEDTDLMRTLSELQNASGTLDIALKSYAQIQRISLFNYIAPG